MSQKQMSPELQKVMALGREYFAAARHMDLRGCSAILFDAKLLVGKLIEAGRTFESLRDEMLSHDPFMEQVKNLFALVKGETVAEDPCITIRRSDFFKAYAYARALAPWESTHMDPGFAIAIFDRLMAGPAPAAAPKLEVVQ